MEFSVCGQQEGSDTCRNTGYESGSSRKRCCCHIHRCWLTLINETSGDVKLIRTETRITIADWLSFDEKIIYVWAIVWLPHQALKVRGASAHSVVHVRQCNLCVVVRNFRSDEFCMVNITSLSAGESSNNGCPVIFVDSICINSSICSTSDEADSTMRFRLEAASIFIFGRNTLDT